MVLGRDGVGGGLQRIGVHLNGELVVAGGKQAAGFLHDQVRDEGPAIRGRHRNILPAVVPFVVAHQRAAEAADPDGASVILCNG